MIYAALCQPSFHRHFDSKPLRPDVIAAEILAKLQTATAAIQELQEMLEEGE